MAPKMLCTQLNYTFCLLIILTCLSCKNKKTEKSNNEPTKIISTDLQVDHFNIWVENPKAAKKRLNDIGFTSIPDSLSLVHKGQGTTGRYFYFLNNYLELIFMYDQNELEENNRINKDLDFSARANFEKNGASPFSIALKVKDYAIEKIPFEKVKYHQDWMGEHGSIYAAKDSKTHLMAPSIFVVYPHIESEQFETMADVKSIPDEYAFARAFYKHSNGAEKITQIIITSPAIDLKTETMQAVNGIDVVEIKKGKEHMMELYFDKGVQGKSFDLRPEVPLKVHL